MMETYTINMQVRWADLDPNFHMLHSRYYDLAAHCRVSFMYDKGLTDQFLKENNIGPILFHEDCFFKREISFRDEVTVDLKLRKMTADGSRWTMVHDIWINKNTLAATTSCDGAWMDTNLRKLTVPPAFVLSIFEHAPKADDFIIYTK